MKYKHDSTSYSSLEVMGRTLNVLIFFCENKFSLFVFSISQVIYVIIME